MRLDKPAHRGAYVGVQVVLDPSPLIGRFRADPQPVRDLHRAGILLIHLHGPQSHALTPGPLSNGQATTIWVPHDPGVDPPPGAIPQARRK